MKPTILAFTCMAVFAVAISSCKKDDDTVIDNSQGKVKTVSIRNRLENYSYDSDGRISAIQWVYIPTNTNADKFVFSYTSTTVTVFHYDSASTAASSTTVYHLNSEGLAEDNSGSQTYSYDGERHLITLTDTVYGGVVVTYGYLNGNKITETNIYASPPDTVTYSLTYLTDKLELRDFGDDFHGEGSKNLRATWTYLSNTDTFSYEYDAQGRVTKETINYQSGGGSVADYTYY